MSEVRTGPTEPTSETRRAEEADAGVAHTPDRTPTPEEDEAAPDREDLDPDVSSHAEEMARRGAAVKGEGELP
jgi:hypothetical protein